MRRSNAQRSAETRRRLIESAIKTLHAHGYAATTTTIIADRAKVSRGAMLHQFPTKVDLMLGVARHVMDAERAAYDAVLERVADPYEKLLAVVDLTGDLIGRPSTTALLEITVGARGDPALAEQFAPLLTEMAEEQRDVFRRLAAEAGMQDAAMIDAMVHVYLAIVRGMSIELLFAPDRSRLEASVALLRTYKAALIEKLCDGEADAACRLLAGDADGATSQT